MKTILIIMCLFISRPEKIILKEDLVVYKKLDKNRMGSGWKTPVQGKVINSLNTYLIPDESAPEIPEYGYKWRIDGGVIHAYLNKESACGGEVYRSIIPSGTPIWIQDDLNEIATTRLFITSNQVTTNEETDLSEVIRILGAPVYLKDGSIRNINDKFNSSDVIGICATPERIITRDFLIKVFCFSENPLNEWEGNTFSSYTEASKDFEGEENCKNLERKYKYLPALKVAKDLGGYIPSLGELQEVFQNLLEVNLTRKKLGLSIIPIGGFWTSSIYNSENIFYGCSSGCAPFNATTYEDHGYVLPFLKH